MDGSFVVRNDKDKPDQPPGVGSWCFVVGEHAEQAGAHGGPTLRCGEYGQQAIGPVSSSTFTETQGAATMLLVADRTVQRFWQDNQGSIAIIARMQTPLNRRSLLLKESSIGNSTRARLGQRYQQETHKRSVNIDHVSGHDHRRDPPLETRMNTRADHGCRSVRTDVDPEKLQSGTGEEQLGDDDSTADSDTEDSRTRNSETQVARRAADPSTLMACHPFPDRAQRRESLRANPIRPLPTDRGRRGTK